MDQTTLRNLILNAESLDDDVKQALEALLDETLVNLLNETLINLLRSLPESKLALINRILPPEKVGAIMDVTAAIMSVADDDIAAEAFRVLEFTYRAATKNFVKKSIADQNAVDDVVQESWISIWKSRKGFRLGAKFAPFMWQIVRRRLWDWLHRYYYPDHDNLTPLQDHWSLVIRLADKDPDIESKLALEEAFHRLPPKYRRVLELKYISSLTDDKIATLMGVDIPTVRRMLNQARRQLRELLLQNNNRIPKQLHESSDSAESDDDDGGQI